MPGHLTAEGIRQAEMLRDELSGIHFEAIVTSDLKRAVDTAHIIAEPHGGKVVEDPLLRERDFGIHTGGPYLKLCRELDPSAETMQQICGRASDFLNKMLEEYDGKQVLAVSHGLFLRILQAVYRGVEPSEVDKMGNAEFRILTMQSSMHFPLEGSPTGTQGASEIGGTAN